MPIEIRPDRVAVVSLVDEPKFAHDFESLESTKLAAPPSIVLDFGTVRHINSSGIAALLRLRKRLIEENGRLVLCGLNPQVSSVFQVTGLDRIFDFAPDPSAAFKSTTV